ncbi:MAG: tRNA (pseudouridine(54)-N(1))-methyltransferase TrmY [Methanomicrobiales archaeon]|nr:tRNA (pseudouridine(54)-N(1))-methyltransferase TrmY [Methanomicrobiales archaeon]
MRTFAVVGHLARTDGTFSLEDLPGSAGRMDLLCRCVRASLFLSHGLRRDAECRLLLLGPPDPPRIVRFVGDRIRSLSPDERSAGSLIKKALTIPAGDQYRESTPGVEVRRGSLQDLLEGGPWAVLDERGSDLRKEEHPPACFLLSDHRDFTPEEEAILSGLPRCSVGPRALHADDAITLVQNERDRREAGWS